MAFVKMEVTHQFPFGAPSTGLIPLEENGMPAMLDVIGILVTINITLEMIAVVHLNDTAW